MGQLQTVFPAMNNCPYFQLIPKVQTVGVCDHGDCLLYQVIYTDSQFSTLVQVIILSAYTVAIDGQGGIVLSIGHPMISQRALWLKLEEARVEVEVAVAHLDCWVKVKQKRNLQLFFQISVQISQLIFFIKLKEFNHEALLICTPTLV